MGRESWGRSSGLQVLLLGRQEWRESCAKEPTAKRHWDPQLLTHSGPLVFPALDRMEHQPQNLRDWVYVEPACQGGLPPTDKGFSEHLSRECSNQTMRENTPCAVKGGKKGQPHSVN